MTMEDQLDRGITYLAFAVGYSIAMYGKNVYQDPDVKFDPVYFGTTVLIGVIAGGVMMAQGDDVSHEALYGATAIAIPIADQILNLFLDDPEVKSPVDPP